MRIRFDEKIILLKVDMTIARPLTLTFIQSHKCVSNLIYFLTCNISDNILTITFKLGMTVEVWVPYKPMLVSLTFTLLQGHSGSAKAKD